MTVEFSICSGFVGWVVVLKVVGWIMIDDHDDDDDDHDNFQRIECQLTHW